MAAVVPSLSLDGWVKTPPEMADYLLSHFFLSEYSRAQVYRGGISSFVWILQKYQNNMEATERETESALLRYFGAYFTNVRVEVLVKEETPGSSRMQIHMYVSFNDEKGREYSLGKVIQTLDSKVIKIMEINNTGTAA